MPALTDAAVRKYKPTSKRREIRDTLGPGLYLTVQPSGAKGWALRFRRPDGRTAKLVLGPVAFDSRETTEEPIVGAPLSLGAARQLANMIARQRKTGVDPIAERKRHRAEDRDTFGAVARDFIREYRTKRGERPRNWRATAKVLGLDFPLVTDPTKTAPTETSGGLAERWAAKPISAITGHDVHGLVDEARRKGTPGVPAYRNLGTSESRGRTMFSILSTLFKWAVARRRCAANPCVGVWAPGAAASRERVLNPAEIRALWAACDEVGQPYGAAVKLLLLTGCRLREVADMRWDEVDDGGAELHLPGTRTKNHRSHDVYLAPAAQAILAGITRIEGCPYVFTVNGRTPVSGWSKVKARLDAAMGATSAAPARPWVLHDLRRTAVTGLIELGVMPHVVELMVNHVSGTRAGVAGVYNRSELKAERRAATERWAAHVLGVVSGAPASVVTMSGRQR